MLVVVCKFQFLLPCPQSRWRSCAILMRKLLSRWRCHAQERCLIREADVLSEKVLSHWRSCEELYHWRNCHPVREVAVLLEKLSHKRVLSSCRSVRSYSSWSTQALRPQLVSNIIWVIQTVMGYKILPSHPPTTYCQLCSLYP